MLKSVHIPSAPVAVTALAEIKAAAAAFDRGESNIFETLDAIRVALEAYEAAHRAAHRPRRGRNAA